MVPAVVVLIARVGSSVEGSSVSMADGLQLTRSVKLVGMSVLGSVTAVFVRWRSGVRDMTIEFVNTQPTNSSDFVA
jgi:hypothetical protein